MNKDWVAMNKDWVVMNKNYMRFSYDDIQSITVRH